MTKTIEPVVPLKEPVVVAPPLIGASVTYGGGRFS